MSKTIVIDPVEKELRQMVKKEGTQKAAANKIGISASHFSDVLRGSRKLSPAVLEQLGFVRVIVHVKAEKAERVVSAINRAA